MVLVPFESEPLLSSLHPSKERARTADATTIDFILKIFESEISFFCSFKRQNVGDLNQKKFVFDKM